MTYLLLRTVSTSLEISFNEGVLPELLLSRRRSLVKSLFEVLAVLILISLRSARFFSRFLAFGSSMSICKVSIVSAFYKDTHFQVFGFSHNFLAGLFASLLPRIESSEMKEKVALQRRMANNGTLKQRGELNNVLVRVV